MDVVTILSSLEFSIIVKWAIEISITSKFFYLSKLFQSDVFVNESFSLWSNISNIIAKFFSWDWYFKGISWRFSFAIWWNCTTSIHFEWWRRSWRIATGEFIWRRILTFKWCVNYWQTINTFRCLSIIISLINTNIM